MRINKNKMLVPIVGIYNRLQAEIKKTPRSDGERWTTADITNSSLSCRTKKRVQKVPWMFKWE